ncbi:DUF411 domain-containing protein [uncultured Bosea sp.]|uniref:DUF411 domain-containing protein n=1 Tax=uncultured Bosea sp. TaxID=211457 RepID=UPI00263AFD8D|nr:DUF411 domain-containing protein [uncultured Bosea sp.]
MAGKHLMSRRLFVTGATLAASWRPVMAVESLPKMLVTRDPNCGCCSNWVAHVKAAGFAVEVVEIPDLAPLKARLGVPDALASCHTAEIGGYVVEGHVPAEAIRRLLLERPQAAGLAVPGMPLGSPGMEVAGQQPEAYEVMIFSPGRQNVFARYRGLQQI